MVTGQTVDVPPSLVVVAHHAEAWTDGGDTNPANLAAPCARHHNAKHDAGWQVKHRQDGTKTWTSPTGHTYIRAPDDG